MRKLLSMLTVIVLISVLFSTITLNVSAAGSNVYEFEVKTKNVAYAGTDAKISYKLVGDKGETDWVVSNGAINGNAYVQNRVDKFELTFSKEVGTVQKLLIKSNQQWASPDWQCEYVIVKQKDTDKSYSFVIDEWFNNKNEHEYIYNNKINCYKFEMKTGDQKEAETIREVELGLVGANGKSSSIYVNSYAVDGDYSKALKNLTKHPFKKGETTTFILPIKEDIGKLAAFTACSDYAALSDGLTGREVDSWFCEQATVTNVDDPTDKISVNTNTWFGITDTTVYEKDDLRYLVRIKMDKSGKKKSDNAAHLKSLFDIRLYYDNTEKGYLSLYSVYEDDYEIIYDQAKEEYTTIIQLDQKKLESLNNTNQIAACSGYTWANIYGITFQQYNNGTELGPEIKFTGSGKKLAAYYELEQLTRAGANVTGSIFGSSNIWIMLAIAVVLIGGGITTIVILKKKKAVTAVGISEEEKAKKLNTTE